MNTDHARERGASEAAAMIAIAPVVVAFVVLVFFLGRQVDSRAAVRAAAEAGAQAAALERDPSAADSTARQAISAALTDVSICADGPEVEVNVAEFRPGGTVTVTVTCATVGSDLGAIGSPTRSFTGAATAVLDTYRAGALP